MRRFSIRDLFWLTLVVAMGVGWWVDREQVAASAAEAKERLVAEREQLEGEWELQRQEVFWLKLQRPQRDYNPVQIQRWDDAAQPVQIERWDDVAQP